MAEKKSPPEWVPLVKKYQKADTRLATWQVINSAVPYLALYTLSYFALKVSFWLMLPLAILTAGFQVRLFIIQHDCGHNSFLPSKDANNILGSIIGIFTLTPYYHWRHSHAVHHATAGDLDFRGIGDVATKTVEEYWALPWHQRLVYRVFRNPFLMFGIAPSILFLFVHRFWGKAPKNATREKWSVIWTNLALAIIIPIMGLLMGFGNFFAIFLTVTVVATTSGVWLFWVQHQFEDTYWRRHIQWDYERAALEGASYLKLPRLLQWFSGNIGFHHIHHLAPKIPNYFLEKAYRETPLFHNVTTLTVWTSLRTVLFHLWDEKSHKLVSFWHASRLRRDYQL